MVGGVSNNRHRPKRSDGGMGNTYLNITPLTGKEFNQLKETVEWVNPHRTGPDRMRRMLKRAAAANVAEQSERKGPDLWHVLVESKTGKKIKQSAMSRAEAWRRNKNIRDLGMEWTLGEM